MTVQAIPTLCWSVAARPSPLGVQMHDAGYTAAGIDFKYVALGSDEILPVVDAVRTLGVRGLGVSMPHKQAVIDLLDEVASDVRSIGACNTVVNDSGRLVGHNTDWQGAWRAIEEAKLDTVKTALLVGGGGVARAIAYALSRAGVEVSVATREPKQAANLVDAFGLKQAVPFNEQADGTYELVVNATPDSGAVASNTLDHAVGVFDVVFQTRETSLTRAARDRGLKVVPGWRMLLHQGVAQWELYVGASAPVEDMARVLQDALPSE